MNAPRLRGWLVASAIFLLGLVVGGAGVGYTGVHLLRQRLQAPTDEPGPADRAALRIGADLVASLDLSPPEAAAVQQMLNESAGRLKQIRARAAAEAVDELRASTRRIAADLPPEKRPEFYRIIARRFERLGLPAPAGEPAR